jgi:cytochrome P450
MTTVAGNEIPIDNVDFHLGDPGPVFSRFRREAPVYWYEGGKTWVVLRYDDIRAVSVHPEIFSSVGGLQPGDNLYPERIKVLTSGADSILRVDPPKHTHLRRMVSKVFTPRYVARLESKVVELAEDCFQAFEDTDEPVDFVENVAVPVSMYVIADMLGVARADRAAFRRWSDAMVQTPQTRTPEERVPIVEANAEAMAYFADLAEKRRRDPQDDLMTLLINAEVEGARLSSEDLVMMARTLLVAGNETTRNLMGGTIFELAQHRDQRQKLIDKPELMETAVDEFVRWITPIRTMCRTVTQNSHIGDQPVQEGDYVTLAYCSANRDDEIWPDADTFDVTREPDPMHLAFGFGRHMCLGANLARLEARTVLGGFLQRYPNYEIAEPPVRLRSVMVNGVLRLPVVAGPG